MINALIITYPNGLIVAIEKIQAKYPCECSSRAESPIPNSFADDNDAWIFEDGAEFGVLVMRL